MRTLAFLSLFAIATVVFMGKAYETSLQALDSTTHAMLALEVTARGTTPVLPMANFVTNHRPDTTFNDHPFTLFHLSGKMMRLMGPEAWTARLIPTAFSVGCVMLTAWLGALLYSLPAGLLAGLILLMSRDFVLIGSRFHLDTPMVFFILLSFILWRKKKPLWTGVAAGLGLWMKSPVAFLIFPSALFALALTKQLNKREFLNLVYGGLIGLLTGSLIWVMTGMIGGWNLVWDYWSRQVWGTAVGGRGATGPTNHTWGLYLLKRTYLPWLGLLMASLVWIFVKKQWKKMEIALPLMGAVIIELVISMIRFKHYWYFVPVFPFLALLCMAPLQAWALKYEQKVYSFLIGAGVLIPTLLVASPISLGPENFPALRKFHPIIQAYGDCQNRILFIDGSQPFGSVLDSTYELAFYTGRKILQSECAEVMNIVKAQNPEWIVVTGENKEKCLSPEALKQYPVQYRFGSQHLLSRIIPANEALNLTPLARELKPPRGCESVPLPNDIYFPKGSKKSE